MSGRPRRGGDDTGPPRGAASRERRIADRGRATTPVGPSRRPRGRGLPAPAGTPPGECPRMPETPVQEPPPPSPSAAEEEPLGRRLRRLVIGAPRDLEDGNLFHRLALVPLLAWVGLG